MAIAISAGFLALSDNQTGRDGRSRGRFHIGAHGRCRSRTGTHDCAAGDRIAGRAKVVSLAGEGQTPIARRYRSVEIPGQTRRTVSTGRIGTRWSLEIARAIEEAVTGLCSVHTPRGIASTIRSTKDCRARPLIGRAPRSVLAARR